MNCRTWLFAIVSLGVGFGHAQTELPVRFENDLIYFLAPLQTGSQLKFYTDTGGGMFVLEGAAERLGLELEAGEKDSRFAKIPNVAGDLPALPEKLFVMAAPKEKAAGFADGMLGHVWFGDQIWTFDYGQKRLIHHEMKRAMPESHSVELKFLIKDGSRQTHFPCVEAKIDGQTMPFLFDTGAQITLKEEAHKTLGGDAFRATSFIVASVFDRWREDHPEWQVILDADRMVPGGHLIQVPSVTIAGHKVGPVWFTRRPDANFHDYMSGMMGCRVEGALGGSLFRYFKITVDYPSARAYFQKLLN